MPNIEVVSNRQNLQLNLHRVLILRWYWLAVVLVTVLSAPTLVQVRVPLVPMLGLLVLMVVFNGVVHWRLRRQTGVDRNELFGHLCIDLTALSVLLYLSGGAANPLISFLLVPVAVAALSLPAGWTAFIALVAISSYTVLMMFNVPLEVHEGVGAAKLHLIGMWLTFVVSVIMIAWFVVRMTASIHDRDARLVAIREQALRDDRVVALGALAAGAAHELGTPLATIAVLVGELEQEAFQNAEIHADLVQIRQQVAVCKNIISGISAKAGALRPESLAIVDARCWLEAVLIRWKALRTRVAYGLDVSAGNAIPLIAIDGTFEQALVNLFNNAADAAASKDAKIKLHLAWTETTLTIQIADNGKGFSDEVLRLAGRQPLVSLTGGAGIGLLLCFSVIERMGGHLSLENPSKGGGLARIDLPLFSR